jgi:very-short-patch-repair endonuclease
MQKLPTDAEHRLWFELRNRQLNGHRFSRQVRIGRYIVDFCCRAEHLIVELDGSQHAAPALDTARDAQLNHLGYAIIRFWNGEILAEKRSVLDTILAILEGRITAPSPGLRFAPATLSPSGRGTNRRHS